jgi:hypothetical protein
LLNPNSSEAIKDLAGGISAAIGVRDYLSKNVSASVCLV